MAWTAEDTFESYSDGASLNGGSGGSGWNGNWSVFAPHNATVTTASAFQGSKSVRTTSGSTKRAISAISSGMVTLYFSLMSETTHSGHTQFWIVDSSLGKGAAVSTAGSNIQYVQSGGIWTTFVSGYTTGQWYTFKMVINRDAWTYDLYYSTVAHGGSESWTTAATGTAMYGTAADLVTVDFTSDNLGSGKYRYMDNISPTSPYVTAATSVPSLTLLNCGA